MNNNKPLIFRMAMACGLLVLLMAALPSSAVPVIWSGPVTNYSQPSPDPTQAANQDRLTDNVWITRSTTQGIFNAVTETFFTHDFSPDDTEWADGSAADHTSLSFTNWDVWAKGVHAGPPSTVGVNAVVHLIAEDIYVDIIFTSWGGVGGGFSYQRSTPTGTSAQPTPTVTITNPPGGTTFAAPAKVTFSADASVNPGIVTNVSFFNDATLLGSVTNPPFNFTIANLGAGSYSITAVATAAGVSGTSPTVNISVVTPVTVSASAPKIGNGQFSFSYNANPGLSYVVQKSSNFLTWIPVVTNLAASSTVAFSEAFITNIATFYRVGRRPNP